MPKGSGKSYLNRYWPFEFYNYIIFSLDPFCSVSNVSVISTLVTIIIMMAVSCMTILGNMATILTLCSDTKKSCYHCLQICLCCADIIVAISGSMVSAITNIMFLTGHLTENHFQSLDMFHQFQYAEEAVKAGFTSVIKTETWWLVVSAVGVTLSTTVSVITISLMAFVRWALSGKAIDRDTIKDRLLKKFEENVCKIICFTWILGW